MRATELWGLTGPLVQPGAACSDFASGGLAFAMPASESASGHRPSLAIRSRF
jgi:hypothetical protein